MSMSIRPSKMAAPIWRSPPSGPLRIRSTGRSSASQEQLPVVPVATSLKRDSVSRLEVAQREQVVLAVVVGHECHGQRAIHDVNNDRRR